MEITELISGHGEFYIQNLTIIVLIFGGILWYLIKKLGN